MPNIEDLMKKYAKEIAGEKEQFESAITNRVSRDSVRRPWDSPSETVTSPTGGTPPTPGGAAKELVMDPNLFREKILAAVPIWYSSWQSIKDAIRRHKFGVQVSFYVTLVVSCFLAQFITSTYYSTLHLYAPEKPNDIASRIPLFSNRLEFASFPVDLKVPLGLIARRLRGEPARQWVLAQYNSQPHTGTQLEPSVVRAETFYAEGSELLVVQGYANDPQIASEITNLYWDYLENEIKNLNVEHLSRVNQWLQLTTADINRKMEDVKSQLATLTMAPLSDATNRIDAKLAEAISENEIKRLRIQKELEELQKAEATESLDRLWAISIPEIQDLRVVDKALQDEGSTHPSVDTATRRADIQAQAFRLSHQLYEQRQAEYAELATQADRMKEQIEKHESGPSGREVSDLQKDLMASEVEYRNLIAELNRLGAQLHVQSNLNSARLRVIQPALPDPTSRRPMLVLVYTVCLLMALFVSIVFLMWCEMRAQALIRAAKQKREPEMATDNGTVLSPLGHPHAPGFGA